MSVILTGGDVQSESPCGSLACSGWASRGIGSEDIEVSTAPVKHVFSRMSGIKQVKLILLTAYRRGNAVPSGGVCNWSCLGWFMWMLWLCRTCVLKLNPARGERHQATFSIPSFCFVRWLDLLLQDEVPNRILHILLF